MRTPLILLAALAVAVGSGMLWSYYTAVRTGVRIGIVHSLSGSMAESEGPIVDALRLGIEEANAEGGIKGRPIEAVVVDCRSDPAYCARQAERLIVEEQVQALFGCGTSECREALKPVVEKHRHLLLYAQPYEGMEHSPNILYGGAVPNQLIMPTVHWALINLAGNVGRESAGSRGKRVYLAGSDDDFSRVANILIEDLLAAHGSVVAGKSLLAPGLAVMDAVAADIARLAPHIVLNTIDGAGNAAFFKALEKRGIDAEKIPVLSFGLTEVGLAIHGMPSMTGHYAAGTYFQSIRSPENEDFVKRYRDRFGPEAVIDGPMETSYVNMALWVQSAREAGSGELIHVQRTILRQSLSAPEGVVAVDPATRHLWKVARIGKVRDGGQFDIAWESRRPLEPAPFPSYRSRAQWDGLRKAAADSEP